MKIFVAEPDLGGVVDLERHRRIDAVALEPTELPERIAGLVHGIEARGDGLVDGLAGVEREAPVVIGSGLRGRLVDPLPVGLLERAVDEPAAGGAAEGDRARSLQDFDALRVVEIAKILHVVAEAVDVEVGARIHAADDELVAVAFALVDVDARNVARDVGEVLKAVVVDELPGHDAERLGNVYERRIDLGRHRRAVGIDAHRPRARILRGARGPGRLYGRARIRRAWLRRVWLRRARQRRAHLRRLHRRRGGGPPARRFDGDRGQRRRLRLLLRRARRR